MADKITQVYNAYKADGATRAKSEQQFRNWMYGDNYRRGVWNDLRKQGASVGTFEHFTEALGYKMNPKVKSKVAKQAIQYGAPKVPDNWGQMDTGRVFANDEMEQQLDTQREQQAVFNAKKTGSDESIVQRAKEKGNRRKLKEASKQGLIMNPLSGEPINNVPTYREKKEGKYWNPVTETEMGNDTVLDWSTTDANGDKVAQTQTKQNFEADAAAKALIRSYSQSKHDKDFEDFGNRFDERLSQEKGTRKDDWSKLFDREYWSNMPEFGDGEKARIFGSDDTSFQKVYNKYGPKMASEKDFKDFLQSHSAEIAQMAGSVNMTPEGFVDRYVAPNFNSIDEEEYRNSAKKYFTPKGVKDMIVQGLLTSGEANMLHITPESYQELRNEAISDYQEYNSNKLDDKGVFSEEGLSALGKNIVTGGAQIAPSAAGFAIAGAEAKGVVKGFEMGWKALRGTGLATKVLGKAVPKTLTSLTEKYGAQTAGRILNAVNNESIGSFIQANARQFAQGSLTMGYFEANNYLATEGREKIKEGKWGELAEGLYTSGMSGLGTGMLFSGIGTVTGALGRNLGVTGRETTRLEKLKHGTEKALFSASALFVEGLGFRAEDLYDEAKKGELTFGSVLENGGKGVIDKITMDLGMAAGKGKRPSLKQMVVGAVANTNPHVKFSAVEKNELMKSTGGKSLFEALDGIAEGKNVSPVYRTKMSEFFNDPNISRRTKQKVAYVVGKTIDTNMPRTERVSISQGALGTQEVRTYSKDGELLTVDVYKNAEAAEVAKQEIYAKRDKDDFITLWVDSLKPTQSENNTALENTAKELGYDDVGVFLADWDEAQKSGDADFLSKVSKTINENVGKIVADRHKQMLDTKRAINEEFGVDIDKVLDKKPVMWKDKEREAVKELGNRLKKGFSDKNDEAQNNAVARQDGADLSEQTELEDSDKVIESSQAVNERLDSAAEAWQKIQDENPDLAEWIKNNTDVTVEDIRENFGDYVADAYMELSNAKAMRDGFIQNTGEKIEDAVRNQVGQAKFTGTMQDKEGVKVATDNSVTVFADKDGNEYTLVGGDVIVDTAGDGSYSVGKSGLVIFRDKDGNLVQRTNFDGLNEVGTFSLEDYANRIRTTLQEQKTAEIQSTEQPKVKTPKEEAPKGKTIIEGVEPEEKPTTKEEPKKEEAPKGETPKTEVPANEMPKIPETPKEETPKENQSESENEPPKEEVPQPSAEPKEESNYEKNDIPMDSEGEPIYEQVPKERTAQDLFDKLGDGNVAHDYAQIRIEGAEKELKEAKKKEPKIGAKINEYLKKKQEYENRVKAAEDKVAYWESVKDEIEKLTHTTPEELKEAQEELDGTAAREEYKKTVGETQPADGVSLAAEFVVDARITPESFRKETGLSAADQRTFVGTIASAEKGGKSIERLGEELVVYDNTYYGGAYFHGDSNDARSAIISALMSAKSRKGLREMAQPDMEREVRERARMRDEAYYERYGMDYEEYLSYSEQEMPRILGKLNNFDEQKYLQDKAEEITNQINKEHGKADRENDSSREESVHGAGDKVLPEERVDDRGRGESPKEHGGREKAERRGNTEDATLQETPSGGEVDKGERKEEKPSDPSDVAEGMRGAAEQFHEERVEKARKAYEEAKASGDASETKRTKDEYRKALDDKLKAQGIGLIERRKTIAKEMGEEPKVEKPKGEGPKVGEKQWENMTPTERAEKADADPLTEDEIRSDEDNKELAAAAIAYLNGDKSLLNQIAYLKIYGNVRSRHEDVPGNSGTEDKTQLAAADNGGGEGMELESGRDSGGTVEPMDRRAGGEAAPGKQESGETGKGNADSPAGEGSNSEGEGGTPGLGGLPAGSGGRTGGGTAGSTGSMGSGRGRGSGSRPSKSNGKRKPAAKQGTTFPNSKGRDIRQETKDAKAAMMAAFAEFKKRGKKGSVSISLVGLNNEQIEYLPEMAKATGRYGIALIGEGIYRAKEWIRNVREAITDQMKDCGFSDTDIDEYIREMWHMPWEMDGETHKIGEWASIKGYANLRESLKEPLRKKFDKQVLAEPTEVKVGDRKNIEETLPFLLPQQQDDVLKAETQFFDESHKDKAHANGKGYMFTNGTGTGKTYTGLGIIKRMVKQGKGRILILTPSQQKVKDWINDGKNLCLDIRDLDDWANERGNTATNEKGDGVVITTFANFGTNKRLLEDQFDAIVYDESHRIMENKNAAETARSRQHYMLSNRNESYALMRLEEINPDCMKMRGLAEDFEDARKKEVERIQAEYRKEHPSETEKEMRFHTSKSLPKDIHSFSISGKAKFPELGKIYEDYIKARDYYINNVKPKLEKQAKESVDKTKVVFLSATPFNTRENIEYAEGYLFSYPERNDMGQSGKTQFFLEHFGAGYKYRYHRLESSTSNAEALAKQEVAFSDWLQNDLGTMSGRVIDSPFDYSRDFPTVSVEHADEFNTACEEISRDKIFGDAYRKVLGDYNYGSALFETMKVSALLPRLREHLAAGRKIVIFHRRVTSKEPLKAPFGMILGEQAEQTIKALPKEKQPEARIHLNELRDKYSGLLEWEKTLDFSMPREQLAKAFGEDNILYFSGSESKSVKNEAVKQFNDDKSGKNIIVIQEASGKEGISLHDTTGKHQRVCITLALPQSPITALQIEGRTYRIGNESNAIFEYPVLGLTSEYNLFASKFNRQVSTTENLALGNQARNLRDSFARGIEEHSGIVPIDQQGVGGKEFDKGDVSENDPFDNAVLDYYTNQRLNKNNREGVDYFPTPEPLGYKMVEWANISEGDSVLEPSAGHGAIARYVPQSNELVAIEPSMSLFAKLQMKAGGLGRKFQNETFEAYHISNKHDTIVMNPPFGHAGATAIAHIEKAFGHLEEGGRMVAIIPRGAMDKKFDKWYDNEKTAAMRAEVDLPDIAFQQAGTSVRCRVVVVDKITDSKLREQAHMEKADLSGHYDKIEDFFNDLRGVEVPDRIIDTNFKMQKMSKSAVKSLKEIRDVWSADVDKDGVHVRTSSWMGYDISFTGSEDPKRWKDKMAATYDKYAQMEKSELREGNKAVFGELKELACKLAGMTEDEMRRYLVSKGTGGTRFRKGEDLTPEERRAEERMEEHHTEVAKAAEKLNTKVNVYVDINDVKNAEARAAIERGEKVKAWYDTRTGEVHVYLPNVTDKYDAQMSVAHEVVAHKGMRGLLGEEGYRSMMRRMYTHLSNEEVKEVNERMMRNGWDFYTAMDEWVADKAEESVFTPKYVVMKDGLHRYPLDKVFHIVTESLHNVGYRINPNVDDVKYWLWESKKGLKNGDAYTEMKRNSFLWRLNHNTSNDGIENGEFVKTGGNNMSDEQSREAVLFRKQSLDRSKNDTPLMSSTKDSIDKALNNWNARRIECFTDDKHGLRVFQQELAKGLKKGMNDSMDSYHGAINQSSIVREKQYQFETRELKTMNDAVKECTRKLGGGMEGYEELNKYAYVKSGLERNRVLFVRDAAEQVDKKIMKLNKEALDKDPQAATLAKMGVEEFRDAFHSEKKFQETLLNSGKISLAEYYKALDEFIKDFSFQHTGDAEKDALIDKLNDWYAEKIGGKYDENENDYSGIRKFDDFDSDAERIDYVMNTEATLGEESKNKLWRGIGGVTHFAIDNDYNYGVISKDVHNRVSSMFSWYIPMRGFKEDTMEDMYAYLNSEISDGGKVSSVVKRADGRTTLADSPLGTAAALAERSISNGEDNRNKQRLYRLVNQWLKDHTTTNEDGKVELTEEAPAMISEVWYKKVTDNTTGETYWEAVMPDIDGEKDPKQIRAKVERFEENMRNAEKNGNATRTLQKGTFAKPFNVAKHKNEHVVFVNVNGKQKMIIMQGNPRPAQAINGDTASDVTAGRLMRGMSAMFTSYNITFSVTNASRDTFFANNNVAIREDAAYYARFVKNQALMGGSMLQGAVMMNMPKVKGMYYQLWSDYKKGKNLTGKYGKYFEEYMNNGGKTGFVQTKTIEDLEKHIRNEATQKMLSASTLGKVMSKVPEVIEALNERSENMNRFACYVTSREMGRSVMRSVSDAKEVSTNFNRKGSGSKAFKGTNAKTWEKWQGWLYDRAKSFYLFFNAGMQSLSLLSNNFSRHPVKTAAFAVGIPILFASSIIPAINSWIASCCDEDDQYDNLSEWERRNNICIYAGHSNWVKVPLPIELRAFYGFGDIALGLTNPAIRSEKGFWLDMLSQMTQILPLDFMGEGGDVVGSLIPDVAKPLYHVWVNRDWTGKPIYKDYDYLKYEPEYQKVFQGENEWFVSFSKFINEMSGGNEHVKGSLDGKWNNPAIWGEIINGYGGGALSDAIRTGKMATRVATWNWEDFSTREVPMARALYSSATEKTKYYRSLSKYAHYKEDADKYLHDFKANLKSDNPLYVMKAISDMKRESPEFVRMVKIHGFEKSIKDLKKIANNEKIPKKARDEAKELINQEKVKLVKEFESDE